MGNTNPEFTNDMQRYSLPKHVMHAYVRAVPEIILGGGPQALFCPVGGGGCFVDKVSEG